jgi:hypothetical protein
MSAELWRTHHRDTEVTEISPNSPRDLVQRVFSVLSVVKIHAKQTQFGEESEVRSLKFRVSSGRSQALSRAKQTQLPGAGTNDKCF